MSSWTTWSTERKALVVGTFVVVLYNIVATASLQHSSGGINSSSLSPSILNDACTSCIERETVLLETVRLLQISISELEAKAVLLQEELEATRAAVK